MSHDISTINTTILRITDKQLLHLLILRLQQQALKLLGPLGIALFRVLGCLGEIADITLNLVVISQHRHFSHARLES